ncbi:peptidoglycan recognition protein family protein [Sinosporangium siamense]|uniref:peptidoglycan recognition protein family protein n=1 Tax=Sinosporangium siamense TaxID=1367973 RepID=UPI001EF19F6B|nr:N-acetylmuramoyl-L-alanine amidase [Sinosporangium siamense]
MDNLITRRAWGARAPRGAYSPVSSTKGVKVHYTGGRVDPAVVDDHDKCVAMVRSIQKHHMDGNGWTDIGYSMVACPHRKVFEGRGPKRVPAANGAGLNTAHYAVLGLVGNSGLVTPNDALLHGVLDAIGYLKREGGAGNEIKGHRDGYSTECPGDALYAWVRRGAPRPGGQGPEEPGPKTPAFPGRLLKQPPIMRGEDVRTWQTQAKKRGFDLDADGAYGPRSDEVARQIQRAHNLPVDGVVGPQTWKATWQTP